MSNQNDILFKVVQKTKYTITATDFAKQVHFVLSDSFLGEAILDNNNLITIRFLNGDLFKIQISKEAPTND